jgi:hypothetical protein
MRLVHEPQMLRGRRHLDSRDVFPCRAAIRRSPNAVIVTQQPSFIHREEGDANYGIPHLLPDLFPFRSPIAGTQQRLLLRYNPREMYSDERNVTTNGLERLIDRPVF